MICLECGMPNIDPTTRLPWRIDGYEINDGRRSIVRAPDPNEFRGLTEPQRQSVAKTSKEHLALIITAVNSHVASQQLVAQLVAALEDLLGCSRCQNGCAPDDMTCATNKADAALKAVSKATGGE